jgi:uncharacterized UPF0160 family protein
MEIEIAAYVPGTEHTVSNEFTVFTHNGVFHSDEVFATALLLYYGNTDAQKVKIIRSRDESAVSDYRANKQVFVLDIGGDYNPELKNFDHHQDAAEVDDKASIGLLWDYLFDNGMISSSLYTYMREHLVQFINNWDLGLEQQRANFAHKPLPALISAFNRYGLSVEEENRQFKEALEMALNVIRNEEYAFRQMQEAKEGFLRHKLLWENTVLFDAYNPQYLKLLLKYEQIHYFIFPIGDNWGVRSVNSFKYPLPKAEPSEDLIFAHKSRFLTIFNNQEAAIAYIATLAPDNTVQTDTISIIGQSA